jgi:uncharacterized protein YutE (UPF0331/DUF86 family)
MSLDLETLGTKAAALERHLQRVAERLPRTPADFQPMTDASDAVVLHLWQAVQLVVDIAVSACAELGLGAPQTYADAFTRLAAGGRLPVDLATKLTRAAGFRNLVAHGYESLDMARVHDAATHGPADLRRFMAEAGKWLAG